MLTVRPIEFTFDKHNNNPLVNKQSAFKKWNCFFWRGRTCDRSGCPVSFFLVFLKTFLKSSTGKRKEQLRWWSPLFCYSPFAGHLSTPSTCCLSIVSIAGACRKFNVKQELFFFDIASEHIAIYLKSLCCSSVWVATSFSFSRWSGEEIWWSHN